MNISDIPVKYTIYPSFHPNRSRFFNSASFYRKIVKILEQDLFGEALISERVISTTELAYRNYRKWDEKGGQEYKLPAFKLTNRQMFWLSVAHVSTEKYQRNVSPSFEIEKQVSSQYTHEIFKNNEGFREDFKCGDMTDHEKELYQEYLKKNLMLKYVLGFQDFSCIGKSTEDKILHLKQLGLFSYFEKLLSNPKYAGELREITVPEFKN